MGEVATSAFFPARPNLRLDGEEQPALSVGVLSLAVRETVEGLYRAEVTIGNWGASQGSAGFLYFDREVLDFGRKLAISLGSGAAADRIFEGRIMALEGRFPQQAPPEILLLAEDKLQDLRMVRRSRHFEEATVDDVVSTIASDHGLQSDVDIDSPTYPVLAQVNQSDLAFLRECARNVDAELWLDGDTLHVQARGRRETGELELSFGHRLKEFTVTADLAEQRTKVLATGWQRGAKAEISYEAGDEAISNELNGDTSGASILDEVIGNRVDLRVHHVPLTDQEGQTLAESYFRQMARRFLCGRGLADGDARLRAGTHLTLNGLGPLFEGEYYVTEVAHMFDVENGYRTQFSVERAGLGGN